MTDTNQEVRETPEALTFTYTNWRGETAERRIDPKTATFCFDGNEWHPDPQWLLTAVDLDKGELRGFAWNRICFAPPPAVPDAVGMRASTNERTTPWEAVKTALAAFDKPYEYLSDDKAMRLAIAVVDATRAALSSIEPDLPPPVRDPDSDDWRTLASGETDLDRLIKLCGILDAADHRPPFKTRTRAALREMASHLKRLQDLSSPSEPTPSPEPSWHADDIAVDRFATAMKIKLAEARDKGKGGWYDETACSQEFLSEELRLHALKADPLDVANFAMFLHQRGETIAPAPSPEPQASNAGAAIREALEACNLYLSKHGYQEREGTRELLARGELCGRVRSALAALSTPEPQTGERDGEVVGWAYPSDLVASVTLAHLGDRAQIPLENKKNARNTEPLVRQSALLAERTAREAAERRLAEVEEWARRHLRALEKAATEVQRCGAVTGPQWGVLSAALTVARAALRAKPEAHTLVGKESDQ